MIHIYKLIYKIKLKANTGYMLTFIHFILTYINTHARTHTQTHTCTHVRVCVCAFSVNYITFMLLLAVEKYNEYQNKIEF